MSTQDFYRWFHWRDAMSEFIGHGHGDYLAELLETDWKVPIEVRKKLAELLRGELVVKRGRGKANSGLSPSDRKVVLSILESVDGCAAVMDALATEIADLERLEPIEVRREIERRLRASFEELAADYSLSYNTVRQMRTAKAKDPTGKLDLGSIDLDGVLRVYREHRKSFYALHLEDLGLTE